MITLIQQGSVCDLESSEPGCQEGVIDMHLLQILYTQAIN